MLNLYFSLQWFTLDEVCKGKLHLKLEWLTLMPDASALDKVRGPGARVRVHVASLLPPVTMWQHLDTFKTGLFKRFVHHLPALRALESRVAGVLHSAVCSLGV